MDILGENAGFDERVFVELGFQNNASMTSEGLVEHLKAQISEATASRLKVEKAEHEARVARIGQRAASFQVGFVREIGNEATA